MEVCLPPEEGEGTLSGEGDRGPAGLLAAGRKMEQVIPSVGPLIGAMQGSLHRRRSWKKGCCRGTRDRGYGGLHAAPKRLEGRMPSGKGEIGALEGCLPPEEGEEGSERCRRGAQIVALEPEWGGGRGAVGARDRGLGGGWREGEMPSGEVPSKSMPRWALPTGL